MNSVPNSPKPIETDDEYRAALASLEELWALNSNDRDQMVMELVGRLVAYEERNGK